MTKKIKYEDEWLSIAEAAELYGVTTQAVRYWISTGGLESKVKRDMGRKAYTIVNRLDIEDHLCLGIQEE